MKLGKQFAGMLAAILLTASVTMAEDGKKATTYKVDASKSELKWNGKKVTGEHFGVITLKEGSFSLDGAKLTAGSFVADMNSIVVQDITDKEYNGKLLGHLKSDDFFSVEKHPTATFVLTKATPKANGTIDVAGNLTIKGITKPISFPVTVSPSKDGASVKGTMVVDRAKYDMKFRSKSFFDEATLGDKLVYDDFTIEVNLVAKK
ncbi:YceI family protein [Arundinibacter roseus]|uniref:YceI family protein n=1 Tax=Arundinibacter roseus TaxID=2070510 RepID=A0A4R4KBT4_9BACT|nr:YceI family protein [Arundinibacter roseus]TDB65290.1 YceI family protein [Arundinibacter roseus]